MNDREFDLRHRLIRNFERAEMHRECRGPLYDTVCTRLAAGTEASKLGISIDIVEPGKVSCPYHFHHAQEEAFVVLEGFGTLRVAGERLAIETGDTIFIPAGPAYPHQILNTSNARLKYLSISTRENPEIVEYPDSDKYLAVSNVVIDGEVQRVERIHRRNQNLNYWDGEP